MKARLKLLRNTLGLTQQKFAEKLGIKGNTISQYESGRNAPVDSVISLICREFSVNETWLRTGAGEMFQPEPENELEALARKYHLSKRAYALVEHFLDLKPEIQEAFVDYAIQVAASLADEHAPADARPREEKPLSIDEQVELYRQQLLLEEEREKQAPFVNGSGAG